MLFRSDVSQLTVEVLTWRFAQCIEVGALLEAGDNLEMDLEGFPGGFLRKADGERHLRQKR